MRGLTTGNFLLAALAFGALVACAPKQPAAAEPGVVEGEPGAGEAPSPVVDPVAAPEPPPGDEDACGASQYQSLIGTNAAAVTLPADLPHRILGPNDAATMDYSAGRLNIMTDENGVIIEVKCG